MLKKIFILLFLFATSCVHNDFVVNVNFDIYKSALKTDNKSLNVEVVDKRFNENLLGRKILGNRVVEITNSQNLASFLQKRISENFMAKGFILGNQFSIKVEIEEINYESKKGFLVGDTRSYARMIATVVNNLNGGRFAKNYEIDYTTKYFIVSSKEDDENNINALIQELVVDFLSDKEIMGYMGVSMNTDPTMEKFLQKMYMVI